MIGDEFVYYFEWEELEAFGFTGTKRATQERPLPSINAREISATPDNNEMFRRQGAETPVPRQPSDARQADTSDVGVLVGPSSADSCSTHDSPAPSSAPDTFSTASEVAPQQAPDADNGCVRRPLSVHALGQFVYCPRSGILAVETGDETEIDELPARVDFLPNYDLERIEEKIAGYLPRFWVALLLTGGFAIFAAKALIEANRLWFYPPFLLFVLSLLFLLQIVSDLVQLSIRRRAALRAEARSPDPHVAHIVDIAWWSMLKAGFESVRYQRPFRHPRLPLEGRPWRVLERDSLRIPVIHSGAKQLGDSPRHVYRKHEVRLAAYALLLEATGHIRSPYGIVLPAHSVHGLAVPITARLRNEAERLLDQLAHALDQSQHGVSEPRPPEARQKCKKCPHGKPVPIAAREMEQARKSGVPPLVMQSSNGRSYHSLCGDRFGSAPPHGRSIELELNVTLE